jgi:hypothetical protein
MEKMTKRKKHNITAKQWAAIGVLATIAVGLPATAIAIINYLNSLPSPNLDIKIYSWNVKTPRNEENTAYTGLNTTFPAQIINTGNVPIHIVACDVFQSKNGKPIDTYDEPLSEIAYLKPQDTFSYNFTKYFSFSAPRNTLTSEDVTNYFLLVMYTTDTMGVKQYWKDLSAILQAKV